MKSLCEVKKFELLCEVIFESLCEASNSTTQSHVASMAEKEKVLHTEQKIR